MNLFQCLFGKKGREEKKNKQQLPEAQIIAVSPQDIIPEIAPQKHLPRRKTLASIDDVLAHVQDMHTNEGKIAILTQLQNHRWAKHMTPFTVKTVEYAIASLEIQPSSGEAWLLHKRRQYATYRTHQDRESSVRLATLDVLNICSGNYSQMSPDIVEQLYLEVSSALAGNESEVCHALRARNDRHKSLKERINAYYHQTKALQGKKMERVYETVTGDFFVFASQIHREALRRMKHNESLKKNMEDTYASTHDHYAREDAKNKYYKEQYNDNQWELYDTGRTIVSFIHELTLEGEISLAYRGALVCKDLLLDESEVKSGIGYDYNIPLSHNGVTLAQSLLAINNARHGTDASLISYARSALERAYKESSGSFYTSRNGNHLEGKELEEITMNARVILELAQKTGADEMHQSVCYHMHFYEHGFEYALKRENWKSAIHFAHSLEGAEVKRQIPELYLKAGDPSSAAYYFEQNGDFVRARKIRRGLGVKA